MADLMYRCPTTKEKFKKGEFDRTMMEHFDWFNKALDGYKFECPVCKKEHIHDHNFSFVEIDGKEVQGL